MTDMRVPPALRRMLPADLKRVVDIHLSAFPGFFLTYLGSRFLRELYAAILADSTGIAFVAQDAGGGLAGFVAGTTNPAGFYRRLIRRRLVRFAFASVAPLLRRPVIMTRLLRALSKPNEGAAPVGTALLMSLAVAGEYQGTGAGRDLTGAFIREAFERGSTGVRLTTDRNANDRVNAFYQSQGFRLVRTFTTPEGREMNEYEKPPHE